MDTLHFHNFFLLNHARKLTFSFYRVYDVSFVLYRFHYILLIYHLYVNVKTYRIKICVTWAEIWASWIIFVKLHKTISEKESKNILGVNFESNFLKKSSSEFLYFYLTHNSIACSKSFELCRKYDSYLMWKLTSHTLESEKVIFLQDSMNLFS